jgi:hypothetical protein
MATARAIGGRKRSERRERKQAHKQRQREHKYLINIFYSYLKAM